MGPASNLISRRISRKVQFECVSRRDSISSLPDEVLGKILSLLPTKLAASTSVMSKRWRNVHLLVDSLDFDDSFFLYPKEEEEEEEEEARATSGFPDFVDKTVAALSKCPIKSLSVNRPYEKSRVDGWIRTAVQRQSLSELHLRCRAGLLSLFRSDTLVKLTLSGGCSIEMVPEEEEEGVVFFPALKWLYLGDVSIGVGNGSYDKLISTSPVLEELFIRNDESHQPSWTRNVAVEGDSLKRLVIYYFVPKYREHEVYLIQPDLVYLEYSGYVSRDYIFHGNMYSLVEARLDLRLLESTIHYDDDLVRIDEHEYFPMDDYPDIHGDLTRLLGVLSIKLKTLHLSSHTLEAIHFCCEYFLEFENLHTLSFESDKDKGWQVLPRLLRRTPNLQILVIKGLVHRVTCRCGDVCPCFRPVHKMNEGEICLCSLCTSKKKCCLPALPLKVLEISGYGGTCGEFEQMRHFLKKLECLVVVKIRLQPQADNNYLRSKLISLPRLSSSCTIIFI